MNFKSAATLLLVTGAVMSGCGGDDKKAAADKPDGAQSAQADATAKASVRTAVSEVESCYVDAESYTGCKPLTAGVELTDSSDTSYTVAAKSTAGNTFVITKDEAGPLNRTCTTKGEGGCPASGAW